MPSRARAGTAHEARLAYRAGPARQTGPRAVLVHRARHVGRPGPARLVIRANRAGPNRAGPDRARAGSGRARPVGQLYSHPSSPCSKKGKEKLASVGEDDDTAVMSAAGKQGVLAIDCTNVASLPITGMVANQEFPFPIGTEH